MSNHFYAINRGLDGFKQSDIIRATSSTTAGDIELRVADVDGQSAVMTRKDVLIALEAFERLFSQSGSPESNTFPPL